MDRFAQLSVLVGATERHVRLSRQSVGNSVEKLCNGAPEPDPAAFLGSWSGFVQGAPVGQKILCNEL